MYFICNECGEIVSSGFHISGKLYCSECVHGVRKGLSEDVLSLPKAADETTRHTCSTEEKASV